jgi:hypothetical protein
VIQASRAAFSTMNAEQCLWARDTALDGVRQFEGTRVGPCSTSAFGVFLSKWEVM